MHSPLELFRLLLDDQDGGAAFGGLQRRRGTCRTEAHHDQIGAIDGLVMPTANHVPLPSRTGRTA